MAVQKSKPYSLKEVIDYANRSKEESNSQDKTYNCMCCICPEDIKDNTHDFKKGIAYRVTTDEYGFIHLHENKDDKNGLTFIIKINNQPEMLVLISEKFNLYAFESDKKTTKKYKESIERNLNNFNKYL